MDLLREARASCDLDGDTQCGMIIFTVPCVPIAQPRPRATVRNGHASVYEAKSGHAIHSFKATVRHVAQLAYFGAPLRGPIFLEAVFVFPRTKSQIWKKRPMPRMHKSSKPDFDNLGKALADALNGLMWIDDSQIVDCRIRKVIAAGDEQPHVEVSICELH